MTVVMSVAVGEPQAATSGKVTVTVAVSVAPAVAPPGANTLTSSFCVLPLSSAVPVAGAVGVTVPFVTSVSPPSIWPSPFTSTYSAVVQPAVTSAAGSVAVTLYLVPQLCAPVMVTVWAYTTEPPGATWPLLFGVRVAPKVLAVVTVTASSFVSIATTPVEVAMVERTWK
ncbi:hypothetical protein D3C86_1611820 [compost metagenome]